MAELPKVIKPLVSAAFFDSDLPMKNVMGGEQGTEGVGARLLLLNEVCRLTVNKKNQQIQEVDKK
jgi:hypothetical protein